MSEPFSSQSSRPLWWRAKWQRDSEVAFHSTYWFLHLYSERTKKTTTLLSVFVYFWQSSHSQNFFLLPFQHYSCRPYSGGPGFQPLWHLGCWNNKPYECTRCSWQLGWDARLTWEAVVWGHMMLRSLLPCLMYRGLQWHYLTRFHCNKWLQTMWTAALNMRWWLWIVCAKQWPQHYFHIHNTDIHKIYAMQNIQNNTVKWKRPVSSIRSKL